MIKKHQQIAVLDFGSQYTHLIARRFRQLGILAKIYPPTKDLSQVENLIGIVLSGGPGSAGDKDYPYNPETFNLGLPILGHCFGHHLIAHHFGGQVKGSGSGEYGLATVEVGESVLFEGLQGEEVVWMSHGDSVVKLPKDFKIIGGTSACPIAAIANEKKRIFGLQFHPEVTHTVNGLTILENFAFKICGAQKDWQIKDWQKEIIKQIKSKVGSRKVFLLVSGGVDSTVCFALLEKALGQKKVYGLHIDTGLMRKNEVEQVEGALGQAGFKKLHIKDAADQFLARLAGVYDPEEKRKIIGQLFIDIQEQVSRELKLNPDEWLLGQGTIYPDTIETGGTKHADTIKTHHNRVERVQELIKAGKIIEPIKDLYKDEVRELGELLGLSEKLVWRQPFPGPGLGIRVLCNQETSYEKQVTSDIEKKIEKIVPTKYKVAVLPIKSVGVQGDYRTYARPAVLEFLISNSQFLINWLEIEKLSPMITNKVREVNRVLLEVAVPAGRQGSLKSAVGSGKLIEASVTKERLELLREIDAIVQEEIFKVGPSGQGRSGRGLERDIWQFPVVLIPFGVQNKESVVLRPVSSLEAMTARFYPLPQEVLKSIVKKIKALNQTSFIFYDVTNKPPGTIEWE